MGSQTYDGWERKKSRIDAGAKVPEKSGRTDCVSEFRRVRGKVRGHGSPAPIKTFRPKYPSMTQEQREP